MAELDDMSFEDSELDQLGQDVLDSARDDVPSPEARDQLLAAMNLAPPSAAAGRAAPWAGTGARVAQVMGVALALGVAAVATVSIYGGGDASAPAAPEAADVAPLDSVAMTETQEAIAEPVPSQEPPSEMQRPISEATDVTGLNGAAPALRPVRAAPGAPAADAPAELGARAPTARGDAPTTRKDAPAARAEGTLGRELARVAAARSALAGGEAARTLQELDAYDAEFSGGAFSVEVAVLRIEALARSGRADEARRLGNRFLAQHPQGLFARRVTTTLRSVGPASEDPLPPTR